MVNHISLVEHSISFVWLIAPVLKWKHLYLKLYSCGFPPPPFILYNYLSPEQTNYLFALNLFNAVKFLTLMINNIFISHLENLYDVFVNIRDDEAEHCKTMKACQTHGNLRSPHSYAEDDDSSVCALEADCEGIVDCIKKSVTSNAAKVK